MPGPGSVLGPEGPLADCQHWLLEPGPALPGALMCAALITSAAQRGPPVRCQRRGAKQSRSRLVDGLVNALVTQPHLRLVGKPLPQVTADLLRAPPLSQKLADQLAQLAAGLDAPPMGAGPAHRRAALRLERPVVLARAGITAQLAGDRRRCPVQLARNLPDA